MDSSKRVNKMDMASTFGRMEAITEETLSMVKEKAMANTLIPRTQAQPKVYGNRES